jgi:hypothetical protein
MSTRRLPGIVTLGITLAALVAISNCGIYGGGGGGPTVDVHGNIEAVTPDTDRDIVVFAYTLKDEPEDCSDPQLPDDSTQYQSRTLVAGEVSFEVRNAKAGQLVIVFLLDDAGNDADGRIDPGDPVAVLEDPDCILEDVPNKYIVQIENVRINFGLEEEDDFPAPGRAEAEELSEAPE